MKKVIGIIIFLTIYFISFSQVEIKKSEETIVVNNQKYYLHKVEAGQTFYSICKAYNVSQRDVAKANLLYSPDIKVGMILKIPIVIKEEINSPDFYFHKVLKGETLFALSKKYNVSIEDIIKHNPDAKYGIKTDQILKIPNIKKGNFDYEDDNIFYYTVESGNTLFSISQKFGVSMELIIKFNPDLEDTETLASGQLLKIPKKNHDIPEDISIDSTENKSYEHLYFEDENIVPCSRFIYDKSLTFNIVVLLPFFLDDNLKKISSYRDSKDKMFIKKTKNFYELYEGMFLALQKLKRQGLNINLSVFDTKNDAKTVKDIMDGLNYPEVDLIIGPVYTENVRIASHYAKLNHVNLVSPLSKNIDLISNNPFIFQVIPSKEMQIRQTSEMLEKAQDSSIIIVHNGTEQEIKAIEIYKEKLLKSFYNTEQNNSTSIKVINFNTGGEKNIEDALSVEDENVVIIPSNEEVFITRVIDRLDSVTDVYKIKLLGSPKWKNYQSINFHNLQSMSFQYISPIFKDYTNPELKDFLMNYRSAYETEPSDYSYEGYDILYYFANALRKYGRHFQFCLSSADILPNRYGIVLDFDFKRNNENGGFENNGIFILKYDENYRLINAKNIEKEIP